MTRKVKCSQCGLEVSSRTIKLHEGSDCCWGDSLQIDTPELKKLWGYWNFKRKNSGRKKDKEGSPILFLLTPLELLSLVEEAGISPFDIKRDGYQLSRIGDTGNYEIGNCRFLSARENLSEREFSEEALQKIRDARDDDRIRVSTPDGIFESKYEVKKYYGIDWTQLQCRLESTSLRFIEWTLLDNNGVPIKKEVTQSKQLKAIRINGVPYESIRQGAIATGLQRTVIREVLKRGGGTLTPPRGKNKGKTFAIELIGEAK